MDRISCSTSTNLQSMLRFAALAFLTCSVAMAVDQPPTISIPAAASPATVAAKTTALTVTGADDGGAASLTYTWSVTGPGSVTFSANGTTAARATTATFHAAGAYQFTARVADAGGQSVTSVVSVTVSSTTTSMDVMSTGSTTVNPGQTKTYTGQFYNQFGTVITPPGSVTWSMASGSGSIDANGVFTGALPGGLAVVRGTCGSFTNTAQVQVNVAPTVASPVSTAATSFSTKTAAFDVQGADDQSVDLLNYTWTATGPGSVSFSPANSLNAEHTVATFTAAGNYVITARIADKQSLDVYSTLNVTVVATPISMDVMSTGSTSVNPGQTKTYYGQVYNQFGAVMALPGPVTWSMASGSGSIDASGVYTAALPTGYAFVRGTCGSLTNTARVRINAAPTVATAASTPTPSVSGTQANISVLCTDDGGAAALTYTWSATGPATVTFGENGTNAAKSSTVTFTSVGTYQVTATGTDGDGLSVTSTVTIVVQQTSTSIALSPATGTVLNPGDSLQYTPILQDQFQHVISPVPTVTWSVTSGGGSITNSGRYTAAIPTGSAVVTGSMGALSGQATLRVNAAPTVAQAAAVTPQGLGVLANIPLTVLGADDGGEPSLGYLWSVVGNGTGVTFSGPTAGTNAAKASFVSVPAAGTYSLQVVISDLQGRTVTSAVTLVVESAIIPESPVITWVAPAPITYGMALTGSELAASASVPGTFAYAPAVGTQLEVGTQPLTAVFTPTDLVHYLPVTTSVSLVVGRASSVVLWSAPSSILAGTPLTVAQLHAYPVLPGTITYCPPAGTVLAAGDYQLRATFTPSDAVHYEPVMVHVPLTVTAAPVANSGVVTTYQYDAADRLTGRAYPGVAADQFTYDAAGRVLTGVSGRYGNTVTRGYDAAGRLTSERIAIDGEELTVGSGYDDANRLTSQTYPDQSQVTRDYTPRGELSHVWESGRVVASRTYDAGGRQFQTQFGNGLVETRTYFTGDYQVRQIQIPGVTNFVYDYDANRRKLAEVDLVSPSNTQRFGYDDQDRVTDWKRTTGQSQVAEATQTWDLSPVGDWTKTTIDGVAQSRSHSPVHEITAINGTQLTYDFKGNLTRDEQGQQYAWDVENRLLGASNLQQGHGDSASYAYDAFGRRVKKVVSTHQAPLADGKSRPDKVEPTYFISAGAQEVMEITGDLSAFGDPSADPESAGAAPYDPATGKGARGSLLADPDATRFNFQPASTDTPDGWRPDIGDTQHAADGVDRGWTTAATGVDRDHLGRPLYDSFIPVAGNAWQIALPNGTYPVVIMCGDADSRAQTNNLLVNGVVVTDPTPYDGRLTNGYETGSFDGYAINIAVVNGLLSIQGAIGALDPKINFIEIGKKDISLDQLTIDRVSAAAQEATQNTAKSKCKTPPRLKRQVWGAYMDELSAYSVQRSRRVAKRLYVHSNHIYTASVITNSAGQIVRRYSYSSYGKQTAIDYVESAIRDLTDSGYGFTGYKCDAEDGLYYARSRYYVSDTGRFANRDSVAKSKKHASALDGYKDGFNLYSAYFSPNHADPYGFAIKCIYRGDSRGPGWKYPDKEFIVPRARNHSIEEVGFLPWASSSGNAPDESIWNHIGNVSPLAHNSPYQSFTTDESVAIYYALKEATGKTCSGFVYKICFDDSDPFWKRAKTPKEWGVELNQPIQMVGEMTNETLSSENEITVKGDIPFTLFTSYKQVMKKDCCERKGISPPQGWPLVPGVLPKFEESNPGWVGPETQVSR